MKKGNRPTELSTENFFNLQKGTKENNTQSLRKNYNSNKNHMGARDNCLCHVQATPGSPVGPVPGAAVVRVHRRPVRCSQDTCDWRQSGGSLPSTCNQHQKRRQYLGIQHVLPRTWAKSPYNRALS